MKIKDLEDYIQKKAQEFGYVPKEQKSSGELKGNALYRGYSPNTRFLAFVRLEEQSSMAYSDLSFVLFFPEGDDVKDCVVSIGIGTNNFSRDMSLALLPGTRRMYQKLMKVGEESICKLSFTDTESYSESFFSKAEQKGINIEERYKKLLPAATIVHLPPETTTTIPVLDAWLAQYAIMRNWNWEGSGKRATTRVELSQKRQKTVDDFVQSQCQNINDLKDIKCLLKNKRYIVIQGAPGTGKTRMANLIAKELYNRDCVVFTQFHAETSFSDFVNGIEIDVDASQRNKVPTYKVKVGALCSAIEKAKEVKKDNKRVLLIIDEINRANLSNVLGPVFYLFEKSTEQRVGNLIVAGEELSELPSNIDVIATMNTADRSLAVVDFALRRRFAWYTLKPKLLNTDLSDGYFFHTRVFNEIARLFDRYANDDELNLQPGQYYFITKDVEPEDPDTISKEMIEMMNYELMPLMKEYFANGLMLSAKDEFASLYLKWTGKYMYE